ncbi:MAG: hypothetical protein IJV01_02805 [Bacteroidales bacterium]|nr:hypothetical protein [Bacteroidales bacterium]
MKKTARLLLLTFAALAMLSCEREPMGGEEGGEGIVLNLRCANPQRRAGTDGIRDGENDWNENLISTLDLFFYPEDGTGNNCVLHKRFTPNESDGDATVTTYTTDEFVSGTLVPTSRNSFWVYAIANYPGTIVADESDLSGTSVAALKTLALDGNFAAVHDAQHPHLQPSFVMDGLAQVTGVEKENRLVAKGSVNLKRVASKISVQLRIANQVEVPKTREVNEVIINYTERWEPMLSGLQLYIENGVRNTTLAAKPVDNPVYFSYTNNRMYFTQSTDPDEADFPFVTDPTYVYPQRWEYASKDSPTMEPTLKLILPWRRLEDAENHVTATQKQFYYKIIIPDDPRETVTDTTYLRNFVRNNWYRFKMNVAMLGSETDEAAVVMNGTYYVVDWQDKDVVIKEATIGAARFLSMEPKEYVMNNVPDLDMVYTSSHPVAVNTTKGGTTMDITARRAYYGSSNAGTSYAGGTIRTAGADDPDYESGQKYIEYSAAQRKALNNGNEWVIVDGEYVRFYHELNNDLSAGSNLDTSPYIIHFNLYHADHHEDAVYKQSIKITQYPAIYITNEKSNGVVFVNNTQYSGSGTAVAVSDNSNNVIGAIVRPSDVNGSGNNNNQYQYTVHITVLPADAAYVIGDPRTDGSTAEVTTLTGLNTSANYRPTAEDTHEYIAPALKIASSYGKTYAQWYSNAQTRCAAYQENGYPAGRWRLPTNAEIEYLITLSEQGIIPTLFDPGPSSNTAYSYYWAGGYDAYGGSLFVNMEGKTERSNSSTQYYYFTQRIDGTNYSTHNVYTRCVYDVWYWGEEQDSSHMTTWGGYQTTL